MASSSSASLEPKEKKPESDSEDAGPECSVCLQTCVLPTRLPCKHVFCFLCAKGLALQSQRCAMCRAEIPQDFLERPELLQTIAGPTGKAGDAEASQGELPDKNYAWFYEGRDGWWQYETRLSSELEAAYQNGDRSYDALIAGSIYTLDFNNWMQSRKDDPTRRRRIKRDLATSQHKGVAGLRQFASRPGALGAPLTVQQVPAGQAAMQATTQAMHVPQTRWDPTSTHACTSSTTASSSTSTTARGVAQGHFKRSHTNRASPSSNRALRRIISEATTNAFNTGLRAGIAISSDMDESYESSSSEIESEEDDDDDSDDSYPGSSKRHVVFVRGRPCFLIDNEPISIDSDSE